MNELKPTAVELGRLLAEVRARTPARLLVGRSGPAYRTGTQLELRRDHAFARDAVLAELDLQRDLGAGLIEQFQLFDVQTEAATKAEFLLRPDLGRRLTGEATEMIRARCPRGRELQIVIGDGLSAAAVAAQAPRLLAHLAKAAVGRGWSVGRAFVVRHCRVGVLNGIGELLDPVVAVLLIGERPGLATAESLSAYMAYRPRPGDTDARRNLISNIHARGVSHDEAVQRILALAERMMRMKRSGVEVKEDLSRLRAGQAILPSDSCQTP